MVFEFAKPTITRHGIQNPIVIILDSTQGMNTVSGISNNGLDKVIVFSSNIKLMEKQVPVVHDDKTSHFEFVEKFNDWSEVIESLDWYVTHFGSKLAKNYFDHQTILRITMSKYKGNWRW